MTVIAARFLRLRRTRREKSRTSSAKNLQTEADVASSEHENSASSRFGRIGAASKQALHTESPGCHAGVIAMTFMGRTKPRTSGRIEFVSTPLLLPKCFSKLQPCTCNCRLSQLLWVHYGIGAIPSHSYELITFVFLRWEDISKETDFSRRTARIVSLEVLASEKRLCLACEQRNEGQMSFALNLDSELNNEEATSAFSRIASGGFANLASDFLPLFTWILEKTLDEL